MRIFVLFLVLLSVNISTYAQRLQFGLNTRTGVTFSHKGESEFQKPHFRGGATWNIGLGIPVVIKLSSIWSLQTGIMWQIKRSKFTTNDFEFPDLESQGGIYRSTQYSIFQLPLIMVWETPKPKKLKWSFQAGIMASGFFAKVNISGMNWTPKYSGNDTLNYSASGSNGNFNHVITPELNFGVGLSFFKRSQRRHSVKLIYEYTIFDLNENSMTVVLSNSEIEKVYEARFKPTLSSLSLSYSYFFLRN